MILILKINDHVGNEKNTLCHTHFNRGAHLENILTDLAGGYIFQTIFQKDFNNVRFIKVGPFPTSGHPYSILKWLPNKNAQFRLIPIFCQNGVAIGE